jgi:hypothetical protein
LELIVKTFPVEPAQTPSGPSMEQVGCAATLTVFVQVDVQPPAVTVVVSVNEPAVPASTVIDAPSGDPTIEPFPETWVENVAPPTFDEMVKTWPVEPAQTASGPAIEQVGTGFTVTVFWHTAEQPPATTVVVSVNDPAPPPVTVTDGPSAGPEMEPFPEMIVDQVAFARFVEIV